MERGIVGSMKECGVTESYKLKRQVILSASEAAEMILRVDDSEFSLFPFSHLPSAS
jgi:T-complex protein 1 subunit beta